MTRKNFKKSVRDALADRVGKLCSYPGCDIPTVGPKSGSGVARAGMACHIYPASGNGPRASLNPPSGLDRDDFENGVWMCWQHGTIIDADDGRFTPEILTAYRQRAELRSAKKFYGADYQPTLLPCRRSFVIAESAADWAARLPLHWRETLADTLKDGGVEGEWGASTRHAIWMLFAELTRNTVEHGRGTAVTVLTGGNAAQLILHGETFTLNELRLRARGGGAESLAWFDTAEASSLSVNDRCVGDDLIITVSRRDLASVHDPCSVQIERRVPLRKQLDKIDGCSIAHLYSPEHLMLSDGDLVGQAALAALSSHELVVIHFHPGQNSLVRKHLSDLAAEDLSRISFVEIAR